MIKLNFNLPDWNRIIWNSFKAKEVWEPRIKSITKAFIEIEKHSVLRGYRSSSLTTVTPEKLAELKNELKGTKFTSKVLQKVVNMNRYSSGSTLPYTGKERLSYRIVLTQEDLIDTWEKVYSKSDIRAMGKMLGYPDCCINFFVENWTPDTSVPDKFLDFTFLNGHNTNGPKECNLLLRWICVRAISHLPCTFDCKESFKIGRQNIELGHDLGFRDEMEWLEDMLSWPVQWSALHGIAEIRTPILKISTKTDPTADLIVVNKEGSSYPEEGSVGVDFPYVKVPKIQISQNLNRDIVPENISWKDNGFFSYEAMKNSHDTLLTCVEARKFNSVIDFGCGNGELLNHFKTDGDNTVVYGIEKDVERFNRISSIGVPGYNFWNCDMFDFITWHPDLRVDLAIVMPGRLEEVPKRIAKKFILWLIDNARNVLFYTYGDWSRKELIEPMRSLNSVGYKFDVISKQDQYNCKAYLGNLTKNKMETLTVIQ